MEEKAVFLFHREFRLTDNTGLIAACRKPKTVLPMFVFTPEQTRRNKYASQRFIDAMTAGLYDLNETLENLGSFLYVDRDDTVAALTRLRRSYEYTHIYSHRDYTPYSKKRDKLITKYAEKHGVQHIQCEDYNIFPINDVKTGSGTNYKKFTPYYNAAQKIKIAAPVTFTKTMAAKLMKKSSGVSSPHKLEKKEGHGLSDILPTRKRGLALLKRAATKLGDYSKERDMLTYETSHLSVYNRFGLVSPREFMHVIKQDALARQMYWRSFYYNIVDEMDEAAAYRWQQGWGRNKSAAVLSRFEEGRTGVPIVDAGIHQLIRTGYMHNRARMFVACYAIKNLGIPWRRVEEFYAKHLIDYDFSQNFGNHVFIAGEMPYGMMKVRVFSPELQAKKYDPDGEYVKKWLADIKDYPSKPIVDFNESRDEYIKWVRTAKYS